MKVLHGADEPADDFQSLLLQAIRGAPRWPAPGGSHAAQLVAEQSHVERFTHLLWVQAWAAGAAWMSSRMPHRIVLCDAATYESAKQRAADSWARREVGESAVPGDGPQP